MAKASPQHTSQCDMSHLSPPPTLPGLRLNHPPPSFRPPNRCRLRPHRVLAPLPLGVGEPLVRVGDAEMHRAVWRRRPRLCRPPPPALPNLVPNRDPDAPDSVPRLYIVARQFRGMLARGERSGCVVCGVKMICELGQRRIFYLDIGDNVLYGTHSRRHRGHKHPHKTPAPSVPKPPPAQKRTRATSDPDHALLVFGRGSNPRWRTACSASQRLPPPLFKVKVFRLTRVLVRPARGPA